MRMSEMCDESVKTGEELREKKINFKNLQRLRKLQ